MKLGDVRVHLRLCLECGHVSCCDSSRNKHARKHFHRTDHPIVRSFELGHSEEAVRHRLDRLTSELGLDRERARKWALGQTIAWTSGSDFQSTHVENARWLLQAE